VIAKNFTAFTIQLERDAIVTTMIALTVSAVTIDA